MKQPVRASLCLVFIITILALLLGWAIRHRMARSGDPDAACTGASFAHAPLETYHSDYRLTSAFDSGSLRVFLRNRGTKPIRIASVQLDDFPIPVWGLTTSLTESVANRDEINPSSGTNVCPHAPESGFLLQIQKELGHKQIIWARHPSFHRAPSPNVWSNSKIK